MKDTRSLEELEAQLSTGEISPDEFEQRRAALVGSQRSVSGDPLAPVQSDDPLAGHTRMPNQVEPGALAGHTLLSTDSGHPTPAVAENLCVGDTLIDRYVITRELGEGGIGKVYGAIDRDTEQEVALKVLSARWKNNTTMMESLRREVVKARSLPGHKNLLRILDVHLRQTPAFFTCELAKQGDLHHFTAKAGEHVRVVRPTG